MDSRTITQTHLHQFRSALYRDEKSEATVHKYLRDVRAFQIYAGGREITKETVIAYKNALLEHYAPASVNSMLVAINCFLKLQGWYDCVVKVVKIQHQSFRSRDRELSKGEYLRLLEAAQKRKDTRLCLLMQTLGSTGIRISELRFITVEAARKGRAAVYLKGKNRQILLPAALCRELKRYAKDQGISGGSIFITKNGNPMDRSNILHAMKSLCEDAHVDRKKVFPHNLRHLFACLYYKVSKDISRLADLLGHSSINTTRIYVSVSGNEQRRQIERLGLVI